MIALLQAWPALRIAIQEYMPYDEEKGAQKRVRLAEELVDAFYSSPTAAGPATDRIEDFLLEFIETEYEIGLEDDSQTAITRDLKTLWSATVAGGDAHPEAIVAEFERMAARATGNITRQVEEDSDDESGSDDDEDESMAVDTAEPAPRRPEPVIDDDGFELVQRKR